MRNLTYPLWVSVGPLATLRRLSAGALVSWLVARLGLLPAADPLAGTLAALPFGVVLLAEVARQARVRGGRGLTPLQVRLEAAALATWVALALARPSLALPGADLVLFGALVLLLAVHVGTQLVALRPLLGRALPERPSLVFLALPFAVYLLLLPWSTAHRPPDGDEPWYLLVTHSLAYDFDADLTNNYARGDGRAFLDRPLEPQPGDPQGPHGELYSRHNALLPLLLAPAYRLGGKEGALLTMALLTAALAWMTLRVGRHYGRERPGETLLAYGLVAFAPPLLLYSYQIWVEVPAALLSLVALDAILGLRRSSDGEAGWRRWLVIGLALALLPLLKIRFMLLAVPLLGLAWWHAGRSLKPLLALGTGLAAVGGGILLHNQWRYHNPLKIHSWQEVELQQYSLRQYFLGASGLFYDVAFGLFACAPLWLLLIPAVLVLVRERHRLPGDLLVFIVPYLAIVTPRAEWYGGWSPPFRYALVALPLLGLLLVPLLAERRRPGANWRPGADWLTGARWLPGANWLTAGLGALTLGLTVLWVVVPGWTYNFADGRTYLLDHLGARFDADVARLFPSSVRPRLATWLWPPLSLMAIPALWWLPWPRARITRGGAARAGRWGIVALLVGLALLPQLARLGTTTRIEAEDAYLDKAGGHLSPDPWVIERTRYRGGWVLREGEAVSSPIVAGGPRVRLAVEALFVRHHAGPAVLEVFAGPRKLTEVRLNRARQWRHYDLGAFDWPRGERLLLRVAPSGAGEPHNGVVIDGVDLDWSAAGPPGEAQSGETQPAEPRPPGEPAP